MVHTSGGTTCTLYAAMTTAILCTCTAWDFILHGVIIWCNSVLANVGIYVGIMCYEMNLQLLWQSKLCQKQEMEWTE